MSQYLEGQTHQLAEALQEHGFTPADVTALGQNSNGVLNLLKLVLMGLATVVRSCLKLVLTNAFNPATFIGKDWKVWKGPADGNGLELEGEEDRDVREDSLSLVDFEQLILETNLQGDETSVHGEEKLRRLKAGKNIRLGGKVFLSLWEDYQARKAESKPEESVLEKLRKSKKVTCIFFFGLVLRNPGGYRHVLYLVFIGREWSWFYNWLDSHWHVVNPSASLASVN